MTIESGELLNDPDLIVEHFNNVVDMIIDAGVLRSEPSSVIDLTGDSPVVVRQGAGDTSMLS